MNHPPNYSPPDSPTIDTQAQAMLPSMEAEARPATPAEQTADELPSVSVIVLNYNGLKHLETCFTSLLALDYPKSRLELMLVDQDSGDASISFMQQHFPTVRIVQTGGNLGFAAGNDYGAEHANSEYIAFLNNDTRVEPDWLSELVKGMLDGRESGVVCTSSLMLDWTGKKIDFLAGAVNFHAFGFQPAYGMPASQFGFHGAGSEESRNGDGGGIQPRDLLFACGGSMLVRRDVFLEVGGFDPGYFAFFEDVDLGWRLWVLGHRVTLAPAAVTYHRHHGTAGSIPGHRVQVLYERNALYTLYKNYSPANLDKILPAALLLLGQRAVRFAELGGVDFSNYDFTQPSTLNPQPSALSPENVHRSAVATLLAVDEFRATLESTKQKREWIQANRKLTDEELFALFGQPGRVHLLNHETDGPYASAHFATMREFGIEPLWSAQPKEVLVVSPDVLPVGDIPASGSGIRAWALGKGLEARGHHVRFTMPAAALMGREKAVPPEYVQGAWTPETLQAIVDATAPDVVVSCGWPNLTWLPRANLPVALDLAGPHLLERIYQDYRDVESNSAEKLAGIERADFFTCIGERQRYYFMAWLAQAGVAPDDMERALRVIPYSLSPEQPAHRWPPSWAGEDVRFVYGGIFLPWQNPAPALLAVASTLQSENQGILEVIGGKHPFHAVHTGGFGPLVDKLGEMSCVRMSGLLPHDALVERYTQAHVAVDVMMPNAERELAFPSRTVHYLWCGLPVIHVAFSEVAPYIREYNAGWVVPHDDPEALRAVVRIILADPEEAHRRGQNAAQLARERFSWDVTVDALDQFVRNPYIRKGRTTRATYELRKQEQQDPARYVTVTALSNGTGTSKTLSRTAARFKAVHEKRRTLPAQVSARTRELAHSIASGASGALGGRVELEGLIAGHSIGQRFRSPHDGLSGVRVQVSTRGRRTTSRLFLRLRDNPGAPGDIYHIEIPAYNLSDGETIALRFPAISASAGRWFYFTAESPDGVPGDAVTFEATAAMPDFPAQRYSDGLPARGFLLMSLEFNGVTGG